MHSVDDLTVHLCDLNEYVGRQIDGFDGAQGMA